MLTPSYPLNSQSASRSPTSNSQNPCPICGTTKTKCLVPDDNNIVVCFSAPLNPPTGWRFVKVAKKGMGAVYARIGSEPAPRDRTEEAPRRTLPDATLDRAYRTIANQRTLTLFHQNLIRQRGLDDVAIASLESAGFYSHLPNARVAGVAQNLPGYRNGRLIGSNGFFIPAYTASGVIVGGQIATGKRTGAKYLYLKDGTSIRECPGPLQFVAVPSFRKAASTISTATLFTFISRPTNASARDDTGIGVALFDAIGNCIARVGKRFRRQFVRQAEYNAQLLGVQLALSIGVESLAIANVDPDIRAQLRGTDPLNPELKFLKRLVSSALDAQATYSFLDVPGDVPIEAIERAVMSRCGTADDDYQGFVDSRDIWIVDGALKSWITAERHQKIVIGCPGGLHAYAPDLAANLTALDPETVSHFPDAGDIINTANVPHANRSLHQAIAELGYVCRVGWWGQRDKTANDIDELAADAFDSSVQWLTPDEFLDLHPDKTRAILTGAYRKPGIYEVESPVSHPRPTVAYASPMLFDEGQRLAVVQSLLKTGKRVLHDASPAGSGKSRDFSTWHPNDFDAHQIIYACADPVTLEPAFADWGQYRGRDRGRLRRRDGRVVRGDTPAPGETLLYESNCVRHDYSDYLATRNVVPTADRVCIGCQFATDCKTQPGWYQHDRKTTLAARRVRLHPSSIGGDVLRSRDGRLWNDAKNDETAKPGTVIILDDVDPWVSSVSVKSDNVRNFLNEYLLPLEKLPALRSTLAALVNVLESKDGANLQHDAIVAQLPKFAEPDELLQQLYELEDAEISRAYEADSDRRTEIGARWIGAFVEAMTTSAGHLHTYNHELTISLRNERLIAALNSPAIVAVIVSDATGATEYLEKWIGVPVVAIAQKLPDESAKLEITQITGVGDLGYQRTDRQRAKIDLFKNIVAQRYPDFATIELKHELNTQQLEAIALSWRSTSRGSNAAKAQPGLITYGVPRSNVSASYARFSLMVGRRPEIGETLTAYPLRWKNKSSYARVLRESSDAAFAEFCHRETLAELWQGFSRLRHVRRPGETLQIIAVNEYPLDFPGVPVKAIAIDDFIGISQDAIAAKRTASVLTDDDLDLAARALTSVGYKLTQKRLAEFLGVSASAIAEYFRPPARDWKLFKSTQKTLAA
jgi:hypothetical protein